eukprot:Tbor_TRINITY_DN6994_c0_g1::TRINITY_DN6994_c0_g1_i1::g.17517::m.17517
MATPSNNYHCPHQSALQALLELNYTLTSAITSSVLGPAAPLTLTRRHGTVTLGKEPVCSSVTPLLGPIAGPLIHAVSCTKEGGQAPTGSQRRSTYRKGRCKTHREVGVIAPPPPLNIGLFDGRTETLLIFNYFI